MAKYKQATQAVRSGIESDSQHGAVVPPIYLSTNYTFSDYNEVREFDYSRSGNPTRALLGEAIAKLENGSTGVITCSGMAAVNLITALLSPDDLLIAPHDCYGGSYRLFDCSAKKRAFKVEFIDQGIDELIDAAIAKKPKIVWLETPSNPLLRVVDIQAICDKAHAVGALVVVDNTFLSPVLQQPLELGADIVVHSTTKYINGHSDVVAGAVVTKDAELGEELTWWANCLGLTGSPFDSYLALRGIRTLAPRIKTHQENANAIIDYLKTQPLVSTIYHPSLPEHPGHEIAARQQKDFGSMFSFDIDTDEAGLRVFFKALELFSLAESLGGVESLVAHPATMTHRAMDEAARHEAGIFDTLIRISAGLEDAEDLVADLDNAFKAIAQER